MNLVLSSTSTFVASTYEGCGETSMTFYGDNVGLHVGASLKLTCEFKCLKAQHVAQLCKNDRGYEVFFLKNMVIYI